MNVRVVQKISLDPSVSVKIKPVILLLDNVLPDKIAKVLFVLMILKPLTVEKGVFVLVVSVILMKMYVSLMEKYVITIQVLV